MTQTTEEKENVLIVCGSIGVRRGSKNGGTKKS